MDGDAGAVTRTETVVVIVPVGRKPEIEGRKFEKDGFNQYDIVFAANKLKNSNVVWRPHGVLEIQYEEAVIDRFKNLWQGMYGRTTSWNVEVRLAPTKSDYSVPLEERMPH